jgi:DNA-binding transcriptional regulator YdaS (Cro superfamily)
MDFRELHDRMLAAVRVRLASGEISERRLAHLIGISQPHMHNVVKGVRLLSPEIADRIVRKLGISLLELFPRQEVEAVWRNRLDWPWCEVPVLEGWIGPGLPLPVRISSIEKYPFPKSFIRALDRPVVARLTRDPLLAPVFTQDDLVLLDHSAARRASPEPDGFFLISRQGEGVIRRLRRAGSRLGLLAADTFEGPRLVDKFTLGPTHVLDVVRAKVVWMGRYLDAGSTR